MKPELHQARTDWSSTQPRSTEALQRYDAVSQELGEEFKAELRRLMAVAAAKPGRFPLIKAGFHRANLNTVSLSLHLPRPGRPHPRHARAASSAAPGLRES